MNKDSCIRDMDNILGSVIPVWVDHDEVQRPLGAAHLQQVVGAQMEEA